MIVLNSFILIWSFLFQPLATCIASMRKSPWPRAISFEQAILCALVIVTALSCQVTRALYLVSKIEREPRCKTKQTNKKNKSCIHQYTSPTPENVIVNRLYIIWYISQKVQKGFTAKVKHSSLPRPTRPIPLQEVMTFSVSVLCVLYTLQCVYFSVYSS